MSSKSNTKKRRVGGDTATAETENNNNNELIAIKSTMNELVHQNRTQNENIANMLHLMKGMQGEMKDMREEITQLRKKCDDMYTEVRSDMKSGFDDVSTKQKYHEVILKNQKWTFPTIAHSLEYRSSLGQHEIAEVTKFLKQVEVYTRKMRYGTASGQIALQVYNESPDFLRYNKELLPYWKEFASAIEQHQHYLNCMPNNEPKILHLYNIELSEDVLDLLAKAFKPIQFGTFVLRRNNLGQKGIEFALDYLESNTKCNTFGLMQNAVSNMHNHINRLCEIIKQHQSIKTLALRDMARVGGMTGYQMLRMIMPIGKEKLWAIDLSGNEISTGGDTFISDFLAGNNHALKNLVLKSNQLDDNDAMAVASALKHNKNLRELLISSNNLTNLGWEALSRAVFDKTSLNTAFDSNHTCHIDFPDGNEIIDIIRNSNGKKLWRPSKLRQKKVYSILSSKNRNCSNENIDHFDEGMPVELLPAMLTSIQKYADYHNADSNSLPDNTYLSPPPRGTQDVKPLSVMFEILQRWDKSLAVFEALSS